jgi:hypothetical protein
LFIPQVISDYGKLQWNDIDMGKQKNLQGETYPSAIFSIKNSTWNNVVLKLWHPLCVAGD